MSSKTRELFAPANGTVRWYHSLVAALTRAGDRATDALLYSSAYLVVIAMVEVATVMFALGLPPSPAPLVVGLVAFAVYAGDRVADVDTDAATDPAQAAFVRRHETALSVLSAAAYGLAIAIAVFGGPDALAITLFPGAMWVLYATDSLGEVGARVRRLKDVLVVNSVVVAGAWAVALLFVPLAFADAPVTATGAVVFGYFFLDTFVNTEIPNVADVEGDREIGVRTLPVVFGVRRTRHVLYGLDLALVAFLVVAYVRGALSFALAAAAVAGLGYALVLAALVGRTDRDRLLGVAGEAKHLLVLGLAVAFVTL